MQNYQTELSIRRSYLWMPESHPEGFDDSVQEDIATKAVLRAYLDNVAMEDAFKKDWANVGAIPPQTEVSVSKDAYFLGADELTKIAEGGK